MNDDVTALKPFPVVGLPVSRSSWSGQWRRLSQNHVDVAPTKTYRGSCVPTLIEGLKICNVGSQLLV